MRLLPRSSAVSVRGQSAVSRPASVSRSARAESRLASSATGGLPIVFAWLLLFVLLVGLPIVMLANGADPAAVLGWMVMVALAMAISWFLEGRRQAAELRRMPKPKRPTSPAAEAFQRRYGLAAERCEMAEESAPEPARKRFWRWGVPKVEPAQAAAVEPVPAFVVNELPSGDGVYDARVYTTVDAVVDAHAEAVAAGLSREDTIEVMAAALRGAKPYSGKAAGRQSRGGGEPRVGQGGAKGYLGGSQ